METLPPAHTGSRVHGTRAKSPGDPLVGTGEPLSLAAYERACVRRALEVEDGDVLAASRRLGVGKSPLCRRKRALEVRHEAAESVAAGGVVADALGAADERSGAGFGDRYKTRS